MAYIDNIRQGSIEGIPEIDMVYTHYSNYGEFKLEKVPQPPYKYVEGNTIHRDVEGVIRYSQGVTIDGHTATLLIITKQTKKSVIAGLFKAVVADIEEDKELLERYKESWTIPVKLGIRL